MFDFLANAFPGVALVSAAGVLFLLGRAAVRRVPAVWGSVKGWLTKGKAEFDRLDGDVDVAWQRIAVLEGQVKGLLDKAGASGQAIVAEVKAAAEAASPAFLQPKTDAPSGAVGGLAPAAAPAPAPAPTPAQQAAPATTAQ